MDALAGVLDVGLPHYLVVAAILFALGLFCALSRRNAVAIMIGIELILNAAGLNFVAFSRYGGGHDGQLFTVFIIVLAAAEAVVGLALVLAIHRRLRTIDVDRVDELKG
jgi:NADH-quinone oxidoreductase subunit K